MNHERVSHTKKPIKYRKYIYRNTYNRHCSYHNYLLGEYHLRIYFFFLSLDLYNFLPLQIRFASPPFRIELKIELQF